MLPGGRNTVVLPVVFDDIDFCFRVYEPWAAYRQPKTANILFAVEATRRWAADGITVNALNRARSPLTCSATPHHSQRQLNLSGASAGGTAAASAACSATLFGP
jgi:NAD(P)-dependent dehydrogenase (short-subunit alcohol dehydrogenase family)